MTGIFSLHRNLQNDNCDRRENFKIHYLWLDVFFIASKFFKTIIIDNHACYDYSIKSKILEKIVVDSWIFTHLKLTTFGKKAGKEPSGRLG
jgi:hypothetical protein